VIAVIAVSAVIGKPNQKPFAADFTRALSN
jgi:hypothetical protein